MESRHCFMCKINTPFAFFYMLFSFHYVLPYWIMCSLGMIMSTFRLDERSFNLILRSLYSIMCTSHFVILSYLLVVCSYHLLRRSFQLVIRSSHSVMCFFMRSFQMLFVFALFMRSLHVLFAFALFMCSFYALFLCAFCICSF